MGPNLLREVHPIAVRVADRDDPRRGHGAAQGDRHEPDGSEAEDRHGLSRHVRIRDRVHGVAERVLHRREFRRQVRIVDNHIRRGDGQVFREGSGPIDSEDGDGLAHVCVPGAAHVTPAACDVALGADVCAPLEARDAGPQFLDRPGKLVPLDQRHLDPCLGPRIPIVNVDVGPTNRGDLHSDEDFRRSGFRNRDLADFRAPWRGLEFHRGLHRR